jgi:hypothetical protein
MTCCRLGPNALNASTASSWRKRRAPWKGREQGAGRGNSTLTPQQEKDSEARGEEEAMRSLPEEVGESEGGAGVEKEERRDEAKEDAKRSILERPRDHREARGVLPALGGATGEPEADDASTLAGAEGVSVIS